MTPSDRGQINALKKEITCARKHLQTLWNTRGYTDPDVLQASIELDLLINEYERLLNKGQES